MNRDTDGERDVRFNGMISFLTLTADNAFNESDFNVEIALFLTGQFFSRTALLRHITGRIIAHLHAKSRNSWQLPLEFHQRELSSSDLQAIESSGQNR